MTIAAILKTKGRDVVSIEPGRTVAEVAALLAARKIGAVLVLDAGRALLGIVSERDIVRALGDFGASTLEMKVEDLMTRELQTATCQTSVQQAMEMMTAGRFRHLPVMERGALIGLISIGDVVKTRIEQQEHEVDSLKAYVSGGSPDAHVLS